MFGLTNLLAEVIAAPITVPVKAMEMAAKAIDDAIDPKPGKR